MKVYKVELYVLDIGMDIEDKNHVKQMLEDIKYPEFTHVVGIEEADVGEWYDNHPLNRPDKNGYVDYSAYFK